MSKGAMLALNEKLEREKEELAQCTFKPKINKTKFSSRVSKDIK